MAGTRVSYTVRPEEISPEPEVRRPNEVIDGVTNRNAAGIGSEPALPSLEPGAVTPPRRPRPRVQGETEVAESTVGLRRRLGPTNHSPIRPAVGSEDNETDTGTDGPNEPAEDSKLARGRGGRIHTEPVDHLSEDSDIAPLDSGRLTRKTSAPRRKVAPPVAIPNRTPKARRSYTVTDLADVNLTPREGSRTPEIPDRGGRTRRVMGITGRPATPRRKTQIHGRLPGSRPGSDPPAAYTPEAGLEWSEGSSNKVCGRGRVSSRPPSEDHLTDRCSGLAVPAPG